MSLALATLLSLTLHAEPAGRVRFVFGGDVIPHDPVKYVAVLNTRTDAGDEAQTSNNHAGWDHIFGPLGTIFRRADVSVVNLETPITTVKQPVRGEFLFNGPPALLQALKAAGVTVATFANNHCLDQHREGIVETRQHLDEVGLLAAGAAVSAAQAWRPLRFEKNGVKIGVLAMTRWLNGNANVRVPGSPYVPLVLYPRDQPQEGLSEAAALEQVRAAAQDVDVLVVTIHWGSEYQTMPLGDDRAFAQALVKAGALLIIGHHPHVLQPVELVPRPDGTAAVVAFSLGNLVSNQGMGDAEALERDGLLLEVDVDKPVAGAARVVRLAGVPTATENRLTPGKRRNVQPVVVEEEISAMTERLDELFFRKDPKSLQEQDELLTRLEVARARRSRVLALIPTMVPRR